MTNLKLVLLAAAACLGFHNPVWVHAQVIPEGGIARNFTLTNHKTGQPLRLFDFSGSIIVLDFFSYGCGPCQESSTDLEKNITQYYAARGGNPSGVPVVVIGVNAGFVASPAGTDEFIGNAGMGLAADDFRGEAWDQFATKNSVPLIVIINGSANATNRAPWEILRKDASYPGAVALRETIDRVQVVGEAAPIIVSHPVSRNVAAGSSVTFSVTALTPGTRSYQWMKDGFPIPDGTSAKLILDPVILQNAGTYVVVVQNDVGVTQSQPAFLSVFPNTVALLPDARVAQALRTRLSLTNNSPITVAHLLSLTNLNLSFASITNLTGLELAANLTRLDISSNYNLKDLTPVSRLTNLMELSLFACAVTNLAPLEGLAALAYLDVRYCGFTSAASLVGLPSLVNLRLDGTWLADHQALGQNPNLRVLSIESCNLSDLTFAAGLTRLQNLSARGNHLSSLSPLYGLPSLQFLDVSENPLADFKPLRALTNLSSLHLRQTRPLDFGWLAMLPQLRTLDLEATGFSNLLLLAPFQSLSSLSIGNNPLADLSPLTALAALRDLALRNGHLATLDALPTLPRLESLDLDNNRLSHFSGITRFPRIADLHAVQNQITDLSHLTSLTNLRTAYLAFNWLEALPGSSTMAILQVLQDNGVYVNYPAQGFPIYLASVRNPSGTVTLRIKGKAERNYVVQFSTDLIGWSELTLTSPKMDEFEVVDPDTPGTGKRFYRAYVY